jgi:hypothetical protein
MASIEVIARLQGSTMALMFSRSNNLTPNKRFQRTALRGAAEPER